MGLNSAPEISSEFGNYMYNSLFRRLIALSRFPISAGGLYYLDYVFAMRFPSVSFVAVRDSPRNQFSHRPRLPARASIGVREYPDGAHVSALEFRTAKHACVGSMLRRPCFRNPDTRLRCPNPHSRMRSAIVS